MPDYAGAVAAIKQRLADNWTATPIAEQNGPRPDVTGSNGMSLPWVYCEVTGTSSEIRGAGQPGNQLWLYHGLIGLHVYTPIGSGSEVGNQYAVALGEIFRAKAFYDDTPGFVVRTWSPRVDGGGEGSEDGLWWRVSCVVPFEYYHRG